MGMSARKSKIQTALVLTVLIATVIVIPIRVAMSDIPEFHVSSSGKFIPAFSDTDFRSISENRLFYCRYDIGSAGDEVRELLNFRLYRGGDLLYSFERAPGSDVYISNSGITAFMDHTFHYKGRLTVHFYSEVGNHLFSRDFTGASLFGFSPSGEMFGVGTPEHLFVITPRLQKIDKYKSGHQFDISTDGEFITVVDEDRIYVYENSDLVREVDTDIFYPRKIRISPDNKTISLIDKKRVFVYTIDGTVIFTDMLGEHLSFKDLKYNKNNIVTGIHFRDDEYSKGIIRVYNLGGEVIDEIESEIKNIKSPPSPENIGNAFLDYDPVPWPFAPFDSMCTVWNHYEQHMSYGQPDWSYLHQGLDIITPIAEPTYAVQSGIVKCVLTIGGEAYWRMAISPVQNPGWSSGWLYAHLIHSSIQFDVGDTVNIYDYLGDIIYWAQDWGHIHFVEITDSGLVWQYNDNEWGINFNPLLALPSNEDIFPPIFDDVFPGQKFAFSPNQTENQYLDPGSLAGNIDIIVKIRDYIGTSPWEQPAFKLYYWVESIATGDTVFPRTLAQILNHSYDFYSSNAYEPYATLLYKRDSLLIPPLWMDTVRNYYHILTNNNGDSLGELWEKQLSFHTADFPNGPYRIFVEAHDPYENFTLDSMDVIFQNGPQCDYVVGDVNSSGEYNGMDITYSVNYFKGGPAPPYSCECTPGNIWHVSGDVNASCSYNGVDVTYGVAYFKGGPDPMPCPDCPPVEISQEMILTK